MSTYRAFRARATTASSSGFWSVSEMEMRATVGGVNIATVGANARASGHYGSNTEDLAFDGNYSTFWASSGGGVGDWLGYDFGAATTIAEILISARDDSFFDQSPPALSIDGTNDLVTWTPIIPYSGITWRQSDHTTGTANAFAVNDPVVTHLEIPVLRQYEVEGPASELYASVLRQYEVEGPFDKLFIPVLRAYIIEGPPPPVSGRRRPILLIP